MWARGISPISNVRLPRAQSLEACPHAGLSGLTGMAGVSQLTRLVVRLTRYRWLHYLVAWSRIYPITELFLRRFPVERRLGSMGLVYRITSLDQLSIEYEIFGHQSYAPAATRPIETFVDLGCNAGWFALWLCSIAPRGRPVGLLVDANPRMVAEAQWHLERNEIRGCVAVQGAIGLPRAATKALFNVHPSTSASSLRPPQRDSQYPVKGGVNQITVPAVSIEREWHRRFGSRRIDLLKLDIEGSELDFIAYEADFLSQSVNRIVLEWHKAFVTLEQVDAALGSIGFSRHGTYDEDALTGLALYDLSA
jgi:FkbM family methyltransferase